jgi:hypothetical protein
MSETAVPEPQPLSPPRRRWRIWVLTGLVVVLAAVVGGYVALEYFRERDLRAAEAEADRLDPGWHFDDLEAARADVPAAEDGAPLVLAAAAKMPRGWQGVPPPGVPWLEERLADVALPARPNDADVQQLRDAMEKVAPALEAARDLADRPRGRYVVTWNADLISTLLPHVQQARDVALMFSLDALRKALDGDGDGALRSCRAALNVGRSLGDEPALISQLIRAGCGRMAVRAAERALAHAEASPPALEELQRALAEEAEAPCQLTGARADRVLTYEALLALCAGKVSRANYGMRSTVLGPTGDRLLDGARARASQAEYLRYDNELVEIAKLPAEQQQERLKALKPPPVKLPLLLDVLTHDQGPASVAWAFHRVKAELRCAAAALAAERYRLAKGHWPERLDDLVPDFLLAVPTDPFDGRPLRLRRTADVIIVYSVGPDGEDNGGRLDRKGERAPGNDLGFQLWDAGQRGSTNRR